MEHNSSLSSSEYSAEDTSNNEMVQKMDLDEKSCLKSDDGNFRIGLVDENRETSSSGLNVIADQPKLFVQPPNDGAMDNVSSENLRHLNQDSPLSVEEIKKIDVKTEKFERNLKKFLNEREPLKEVQLRKKTEISARQVRSDGEMTKIIEYCGDVLKLSSNLSNSNRSSAPPSLNNEIQPKQKSETDVFCVEFSKNISKGTAQDSDVFNKGAGGTVNSSPTKALDLRLNKLSAFKVPISPDQKRTPGESSKVVSTGSKEKVVTPVQRRPTHFNVRPRKAYYTFSPDCCSAGVLRQCQSLPDITRPRRKDEVQRRSINFGEYSRIVRSLFRDEPEPTTPESKVSTVNKNYKPMEMSEITENAPEMKEPETLQNRSSRVCRKLVFVSSSKELPDGSQIYEVEKASHDVDVSISMSPETALKEEVPQTLPNHPSKSFKNQNFNSFSKETSDKSKFVVKNVCCTAEAPKNTSSENSHQVEAPKPSQNRPSKSFRKPFFCSSSKETADKSQQAEESCDAESPTKRKSTSPVKIGCSISAKKVKTSSGTPVEESGNEQIVSLIDVESSISTKKVRTSSESKMEEGWSDKSVMFVDVGCSASTKVKESGNEEM